MAQGNSFGTTAFTSYGLFWLSLAGILIIPTLNLGVTPDPVAMASYLALWGVFTGIMFIATLRLGRGLQVVFLSLTVLFLLLAMANGWENAVLLRIAGYEGIFCGAAAAYVGLGQLINEVHGRTVFPQ
jgi:succinate-acetate transporter protein